jgi:hypothetical protein
MRHVPIVDIYGKIQTFALCGYGLSASGDYDRVHPLFAVTAPLRTLKTWEVCEGCLQTMGRIEVPVYNITLPNRAPFEELRGDLDEVE